PSDVVQQHAGYHPAHEGGHPVRTGFAVLQMDGHIRADRGDDADEIAADAVVEPRAHVDQRNPRLVLELVDHLAVVMRAEPADRQILQFVGEMADDAGKPADQNNDRFHHPTLPSSEIATRLCASMANSIGSACKTSRQNPLTTSATASSSPTPRERQ